MRTGPRLMGSPRQSRRALVSSPALDPARSAVISRTIVYENILPYARLLFRVPSFQRLARILSDSSSTCPWVPSLFATSPVPVHSSRGHPRPGSSFRPQVFATSRRLAPRTGSRACFIPLPRPGFSCSRPSLFAQLTLPHRKEPAPLALPTPRSPTEVGCHVGRPRLRGFHPREGAFQRFGYSPPRGRCLLQVPLLQVTISHRWPRLLEAIRP